MEEIIKPLKVCKSIRLYIEIWKAIILKNVCCKMYTPVDLKERVRESSVLVLTHQDLASERHIRASPRATTHSSRNVHVCDQSKRGKRFLHAMTGIQYPSSM